MQKKPMGTKASGTQAVRTVSKAEVAEGLAKGGGRLPAEEEKALRMMYGVPAPHTLVLERVGQEHPDSRERLLGLELELLRQWRERQAGSRPDPRSQAVPAAAPASNPGRARIVQALRSRKR